MWFFRSLLNAKSDMLDPNISKRLPQHPVASALETEPTEKNISTAMKAMANAKAEGRDGRPAKLLKLGLQHERTILLELHNLPYSSGVRGKSHSSGKTRPLPYSTRRAKRRSAETTTASRSCHTLVRFSLKWLPGDSALTVRRRDCYRRSSAGFNRIAPPRT